MKIYNTIHQQKEKFETITPNVVKMYTCGQTVYNDIHVGNARFYVAFDAIRRYLMYKGMEVQFVQNFTDIDDKIIEKANAENITTEALSKKYIDSTLADLKSLNVLPATKNPLATEEIPEIIQMIEALITAGSAYNVDGTVYFGINTFPDYGKLSRKNIEDLEAGARIEVESAKKHPGDFVLWKPAKPGEPQWESPWGSGRPGWHIECSAMIRKYLGDEIDIHGGGADLIFPHHENEIAQSETATGKNFTKYWMHCGSITVEHKKMSKSRGNFATLKDLASKYDFDVIRFYFVSGHYRMPMEFTDDALLAAKQGLARIKNCYASLLHKGDNQPPAPYPQADDYFAAFITAMEDDFNTADAISAIFNLAKHANTQDNLTPGQAITLATTIYNLLDILGIKLATETETRAEISPETVAEIEDLIQQRQAARKAKDFAKSDEIRDKLLAMGIEIKDTREGVHWQIKK